MDHAGQYRGQPLVQPHPEKGYVTDDDDDDDDDDDNDSPCLPFRVFLGYIQLLIAKRNLNELYQIM